MEDRSRRRARLVLIVGLLIAVLAGAGTFLLSSGSKTEAPPPVPTTDVLVASHDIPSRTALTAADLKVQKYPTDIAPVAALAKPADVIGKIVQVPISAGEPILPTKFAAAGAATFTVFPPNAQPVAGQPIAAGTPDYRAQSITVPDANAAGGAVQVGDIVDILFTFQFDPAKFLSGTDPNRIPDFSSKIVLQNVVILARAASVYTIRTDAQTAEKIAYLNAAGGTLQMLLRAAQDERQASTVGATFGDVYRFGIKIPLKTAP
ncbi:MAG TPA: Flp pilus assembly protein CpaB, partial [Candidatus Limnocylindria bacterium]|nr:Flp pilus assembly protein CpaB [Candidatus Limnocylindria bacterium]